MSVPAPPVNVSLPEPPLRLLLPVLPCSGQVVSDTPIGFTAAFVRS